MRNIIYILLLCIGASSLPCGGADPWIPDEGLSTIRVIEIAEESRKVICTPVGVRVHAPDNPDREPIIMRVGDDVAVNGQISILASSTEADELQRRVARELGPGYSIEYGKNPSWGIEVNTHGITLATRPFAEGPLGGWSFMAMIPAPMASPAVSLTFRGEIRTAGLQKKSATSRTVRTITMSGSSATTSSGDSVRISNTLSSSDTAVAGAHRKYRLSTTTIPLAGSWEKDISAQP